MMFGIAMTLLALGALMFCGLFWLLRNPLPVDVQKSQVSVQADRERLRTDVEWLAGLQPSRSVDNPQALDAAADYVEDRFQIAGCQPVRQMYKIGPDSYYNIGCTFGPTAGPRLVIGAHYDVAGNDNPGADDNASAVAGILELSRMLANEQPELEHRLDIIAYSSEEPPNFGTANMGSYAHAGELAAAGEEVLLMISVEMIGFFSDMPGSQTYPLSFLRLFYPDKGNFIGVVGQATDRNNVARVKALMQVHDDLPVYSINSPPFVPGIELSDHWGYWQHGFPAVMITDTAFLRNPNYHLPTDTPDTLDYERLAKTVDGLYQVAVGFGRTPQ